MVKTSKVVLELPKRTAVLVDDRAAEGARSKVRGLFWLTLATVVLGLVVVLASLWKTLASPSVPAAPASSISPVMMATPAIASPLTTCELPPSAPQSDTAEVDDPLEPELDAAPATPPGPPNLEQYR